MTPPTAEADAPRDAERDKSDARTITLDDLPPRPPLPPLRPLDYAPPLDAMSVIHADEDLLIVDKPSGLLMVPGRAAELADCLQARAAAEFPGALIVHRLDLDTSGVCVLARNPRAQRILGLQFEKRHVAKTYLAVVGAPLPSPRGRIIVPLMPDWPERPRQKADPQGRAAITDWETLPADLMEAGATRLRLHPLTGRSHQLRAHLHALDRPILGDPLYADAETFAAAPRLLLHADRLDLRHPADGRHVSFAARAPF